MLSRILKYQIVKSSPNEKSRAKAPPNGVMGDCPLLFRGEGLGLVVLEAMACRRPVVSTNVNGINEIIENNVNGLICEYGDVNNFRENLGMVLCDRDTREKLVTAGADTLKNSFNSRFQAREHIGVYEQNITPNPII